MVQCSSFHLYRESGAELTSVASALHDFPGCRVEYFGQKLDGFCFTEHGWVQSYGSRYVRPPVIFGDVKRQSAMTVKEFKYAQDLTKRPVKGMLTGPVTILNWSFPRKDITREAQAFQIALALREEVADLESAGCRVIQVCWLKLVSLLHCYFVADGWTVQSNGGGSCRHVNFRSPMCFCTKTALGVLPSHTQDFVVI